MNTQIATLAGGCFWCTEAVFQRLPGVMSVVPGYAGGHLENPTYEEVVQGDTGHAEAVQIKFDADVISYEQLLDIFWQVHDPTSLDRQGNDMGPQYRSVIFYENEQQQKIAEQSKQDLAKSGKYNQPIVTQIMPLTKFYEAEKYHHNYFERNKDQAYCRIVINPKLKKIEKLSS